MLAPGLSFSPFDLMTRSIIVILAAFPGTVAVAKDEVTEDHAAPSPPDYENKLY